MSKLKAALDLFNIEYKTLVGCVQWMVMVNSE